jgi:HK97 family phage prohead protease
LSTATKRRTTRTPLTAERRAERDSTRLAKFLPTTFDSEAGTVEAVFATETSVRKYFGTEILQISAQAIDLVDFVGAPVLDTHDRGSIRAVIGIVSAYRIHDRKLIGTIRFSKSPEGQAAMAKVAAGEVRDVSVGYTIEAFTETRNAENRIEMTATRWRPFEVSLTAVGADRNAKIRSKETRTMDPDELEELDANEGGNPPPDQTRTRSQARAPAALSPRIERQIERIRSQTIEAGVAEADVDEALDDVRTVDDARTVAFDLLAERSSATRSTPQRTEDRRNTADQRRDLMVDAVRVMFGGEPAKEAANPYYGQGMSSLARTFLEGAGISTRRMSDAMVIDEAMTRAFHTTSDFPTIFIDGSQKWVTEMYMASTTALKPFSRKMNLTDFRSQGIVRPGGFPTHKKLTEAGEIKFSTIDIEENAIKLGTFAIGLRFTREVIVNDRLGIINSILAEAPGSAINDEGDLFFELLSDNAFGGRKLADGKNLFHADHGNLAASGSELNVASVSAARRAMRLQKGVGGKRPAGTAPAYILVGPNRETEAEQLVASLNATTTDEVNPFGGKMKVAVEDRYEGNGWWVLADPKTRPAFVHGYLDGWVEGPRIRIDEPFGTRGLGITSDFDFGCGVYDFRAIYFNPGVGGS